MLNVGIVGLPNVGKSSLFNALTSAGAPSENYPFCTVDPNVGTVEVPDERLLRIHALSGSRELTPTFIHFVDIAGLVEGASEGEGLGNQFLGQIREVHAIAHVLRCFEDPDVAHVLESVDPVRDKEIVDTELALADLDTVERRLERVDKKARTGEKEAIAEQAVLRKFHQVLAEGRPLRTVELREHEERAVRGLHLLTSKPVLYVANVAEEDVLQGGNEHVRALEEALRADHGGGVRVSAGDGLGPDGAFGRRDASGGGSPIVQVCTRIEAEVAELDPDQRKAFLAEMGLERSGLERLIQAAYRLLGLVTFFTTSENESRAWTVRSGVRAPQAAGEIHTDFERGFIRAETISFEDYVATGSMKTAREHGLIRSEGRDYTVKDGDIILFRFNV